jgi:hypothetical protein
MKNISYQNQEDCIKKGKKLPFINDYNKMSKEISKKYDFKKSNKVSPLNIEQLNQLSSLNIYNKLSSKSILNTFNYMYFKIRLGIFVEIKDNKLHKFIPFVNSEYKNDWKSQIYFPENIKTLSEYERYRSKILNRYEKLEDLEKWSSNNCLIGSWKNEGDPNAYVGDMGWNELYEMIDMVCNNRKINDIVFFVNRRDHPSITRNLYEPYFHIWDSMEKELTSHKYDNYAPIFSYCSTPNFADIMIPTYACWREITKKYYPTSCANVNKSLVISDWDKKKATAIFRGSATGCGISPDTNQRLKIAELSYLWSKDKKYNYQNEIDGIPYLNAGVVGWNKRDKKFMGKPVDIINVKMLKFNKVGFIDMNDQTNHKYIIHIDGHVSAYRLSKELSFGCVILKVDSLYDYQLWFSYLLKPWIHYIPVKKDMSNLADVITWCKKNDSKCKSIAENAKLFYQKYIQKDFIYDYMQTCFNNMSFKYGQNDTSLKINDELKKPIEISKKTVTINNSLIDKYYDYFDKNKNLFLNHGQELNLTNKINLFCKDDKYVFFKKNIDNFSKISSAKIVINMKNDSQLNDNNSIVESIVNRFGNSIKIDLELIPKLHNNIIIKKIDRKFIKNGEINISEFPKNSKPVDLLVIDYDNMEDDVKLKDKETEYFKMFEKIYNFVKNNMKDGGNSIIRIYDFNELKTKELILKFDKMFNNIFIDKNELSDQYNNIKYLICKNYNPKNIEKSMDIKELNKLNKIFIEYQIKHIRRFYDLIKNYNIDLIKNELEDIQIYYSKKSCFL